jgi:hypothetical protein
MRAIDIKVAVRVALIYGIRGLSRGDDKGILTLDESNARPASVAEAAPGPLARLLPGA